MATFLKFPSAVPAIAVLTRAKLLSLAGGILEAAGREGEFARLFLADVQGRIVFASTVFRIPYGMPKIVKQIVPFVRPGYTCWFVYSYYPSFDKEGFYQDKRRYPFQFQLGKGGQTSILIRGDGSPELQRAIRIGRTGRRGRSPKQGREWTSASQNGNKSQIASVPTWNYTNGSGTSGTKNYTCYSRTKSGVVTPNYRRKLDTGSLPINPYSMSLTTITDGGFSVDSWNSDGTGSFSTQGGLYSDQFGTAEFGSAPGSPPSATSVEFRAQRKLREKLGPSNNIAQDLAQYWQVSDLVGNNLNRIARSVEGLREKNIPKAISSLWHSSEPKFRKGYAPNPGKSLADNWLALQYGWKPLLGDIKGLMDSLKRFNTPNEEVFAIKSSAQLESRSDSRMFLNVSGPRTYTGYKLEIAQTTVRYGIRYKIDDRLKVFLSQTGFDNPISLAWEVLPWSFVVDWALPIGPFFESLTAYRGLVFLDGWKSTLTEVSTSWQVGYSGKLFPADPKNVQMVGYAGTRKSRVVSYARTKLTAFPTSPIPTPQNPATGHHVLNALALVTTAFTGKR